MDLLIDQFGHLFSTLETYIMLGMLRVGVGKVGMQRGQDCDFQSPCSPSQCPFSVASLFLEFKVQVLSVSYLKMVVTHQKSENLRKKNSNDCISPFLPIIIVRCKWKRVQWYSGLNMLDLLVRDDQHSGSSRPRHHVVE